MAEFEQVFGGVDPDENGPRGINIAGITEVNQSQVRDNQITNTGITEIIPSGNTEIKSSPPETTCGNCINCIKGDAGMECHVQPPQIVSGGGMGMGRWPRVKEHFWCASWKPKHVPAPPELPAMVGSSYPRIEGCTIDDPRLHTESQATPRRGRPRKATPVAA